MSRASHPFASFRIASSLILVALGSLGALASCGGGSAGTKEDFINAYCDKFAPCCEQAGLPSNGSQCRLLLGLATGTYDSKSGEACLAAIDASSTFCEDGGNVPECQSVFSSAAGTVQPGGECTDTSDCAASSDGKVDCAFAFGPGGTEIQKCQVQVDGKAGDSPCVGTKDGNVTTFTSADDVPAKGYICDVAKNVYCDSSSTKCTATSAVGAACTGGASYECGNDGFCDFSTQKCAARLDAGAACSGSDSCKEGNYCDFDTMKCTASIPDGSACTSSEPCAGGICVNGKCGSSSSSGLSFLCGGG